MAPTQSKLLSLVVRDYKTHVVVATAAVSAVTGAMLVAKRYAAAPASGRAAGPVSPQTDASKRKSQRVAVDARFFKRFASILKVCIPSWRAVEVRLIAVLTVLLVSRTVFSVIIAEIVGANAQAIVENNLPRLFQGLWQFALMTVPSASVNSLIKYCSALLNLRFRERLSVHVHREYIRGTNVYKAVSLGSNRIDNADQRVTADLEQFALSSSQLYSTIFKPLLDVVLFTSRLVSINGPLLPGLMFGYFGLSSWVKKMVMPPIGKLTAHGSELEGSYRTAHQRLIANAEEIAFFSGAQKEQHIISMLFARLHGHLRKMHLLKFTVGVFDGLVVKYWASIVGYFALMATFALQPKKATSDFTKDYIRNISYLTSLTVAVGQLVLVGNNFTQLAGYTSRVSELLEMVKKLDKSGTAPFALEPTVAPDAAAEGQDAETTEEVAYRPEDLTWIHEWRDRRDAHKTVVEAPEVMPTVQVTPPTPVSSAEGLDIAALRKRHTGGKLVTGDHIEFHDVDIVSPEGKLLVSHMSFKVPRGRNVMVTGPNGAGKSSLFRVIGELWPLSCGVVMKPPADEFLFIPQKPYQVLGTLRDQIIYPHSRARASERGVNDDDLKKLVELVDPAGTILSQFSLDDVRDWTTAIGGGQKQRVAMARLFYHKPNFAILDECTSAVSDDVEDKMYKTCKEMGITLFTVSHRKSHRQYHDFECRFDGKGGYSWTEIDD
jgi:ATP-binding cassette, subfamily D (ALD), member 3